MQTEFKLDDSQIERLKKFQESIKEKYGQYGLYDYIFTPYGIGDGVKVKSYLSKEILDLSDVDKW